MTTFFYWLSVQQTVLAVACTLFCHPEDDHHDVHYHPVVADGDHPNQGNLQEVQGQLGRKSSSQVQATHCATKQPVVLIEQASHDWVIEKLPRSHHPPLLGKVKRAGQSCCFRASSGGSLELQSLCLKNLHLSEHFVGKNKPQLWKVSHARVQFQWKKNTYTYTAAGLFLIGSITCNLLN